MGAASRSFVDWLVSAGVGVWQILPLVPPGPGQSPYGTAAALAGSPQLIDLEGLVDAGLLDATELETDDGHSLDWARWGEVLPRKDAMLAKAAKRLVAGTGPLADVFVAFAEDASNAWARDAATFFVAKHLHDDKPWWEWSEGLKRRDAETLAAFVADHQAAIDEQVALFFLFEHQWAALKRYANDRGVEIFGDLPIYVALDSVDVWTAPEQFDLDQDLKPREVAGVPPDYFSETGQFWGNPLYDWEVMAANKHAWWAERLERAMALYDIVRIDHFRAFAGYWAIPADAPDATHGTWRKGPGRKLFDDVKAALGRELPLVAEDLGDLDEAAHQLRIDLEMPGMVILQFAFGAEQDHAYLPHMHRADQIAYTGTHDNDTTLGFWQSAPEHVKHHVRTYLGVDGSDVVWDLIRAAMRSQAGMAVIPMQDLLALDSGARFNTPGTIENNWAWRARAESFTDGIAAKLAAVVKASDRLPG